MKTRKIEQELEKVPEFWRQELLEFLSDEKRFQQLEHVLQRSSLMIKGDGYQISIHSVEELGEIKEFLGVLKPNTCIEFTALVESERKERIKLNTEKKK